MMDKLCIHPGCNNALLHQHNLSGLQNFVHPHHFENVNIQAWMPSAWDSRPCASGMQGSKNAFADELALQTYCRGLAPEHHIAL